MDAEKIITNSLAAIGAIIVLFILVIILVTSYHGITDIGLYDKEWKCTKYEEWKDKAYRDCIQYEKKDLTK